MSGLDERQQVCHAAPQGLSDSFGLAALVLKLLEPRLERILCRALIEEVASLELLDHDGVACIGGHHRVLGDDKIQAVLEPFS